MKSALLLFLICGFVLHFCTSVNSQRRESAGSLLKIVEDYQNYYSIEGDFNGDLITETAFFDGETWNIIFNDTESGIVKCARGQTTGHGVYSGDFNGDGVSDKITFVGETFPSRLGIRDEGPGTYVSYSEREDEIIVYSFRREKRWSEITGNSAAGLNAVGDFNGDGLSDAVTVNQSNLIVLLNDYNRARFIFREQFRSSTWLENLPQNGQPERIITGDFVRRKDLEDRGFDDLAIIYLNDETRFVLFFESNGVRFNLLNKVNLGREVHPESIFIEDIDFDGTDDFIFTRKGDSQTPDLSILSYDGKIMEYSRRQFKNFLSDGEKLKRVGDYNGDGILEVISEKNIVEGIKPERSQLSLKSFNSGSGNRHVGVYLSLSYYIDGELVVGWNQKDPQKTPIAGWGDKEVPGVYSSQDVKTLRLQLRAMKKAGIDFVIADISNGWADIYEPWPVLGKGAGIPKNSLDKLFIAAGAEGMKVAIMLGLEFQGPIRFKKWEGAWDGWENQYSRISIVTEEVKKKIRKYPDIYYYHHGKPLLPLYLNEGYDFPPRDPVTKKPIPMWHLPEFTVRYVVGPYSTFDRDNNIYKRRFEGIESKRFWGWGAGAYDNEDPKHSVKLPVNLECMSVMPGQRFWNRENNPVFISRRGGEFYIRSWKQLLEANPEMVVIADWNNWIEETAIENCEGQNGWKDRQGNPAPDWYLKITQKYSYIFKNGTLPHDDLTWLRESGENILYNYDGNPEKALVNARVVDTLEADYSDELDSTEGYPRGEPDILLPKGWLENRGYIKREL